MSKRSYFSQYECPNIVIVPTVSCNGETLKKKEKREPKTIEPNNNILINTKHVATIPLSGDLKSGITKEDLDWDTRNANNILIDCSNKLESESEAVEITIKNSGDIKYKNQDENVIKNIPKIKEYTYLESNNMEQNNLQNKSAFKQQVQFRSQDKDNIQYVGKSKKLNKYTKNLKNTSAKKVVMKIELYINDDKGKPHITFASNSDTDDSDETNKSDEVLQNVYSKFFDEFDVDEIVSNFEDPNMLQNKNENVQTKSFSRINNESYTTKSKSEDSANVGKERIQVFDENKTKLTQIKKEDQNIILIDDSNSEKSERISAKSCSPVKSRNICNWNSNHFNFKEITTDNYRRSNSSDSTRTCDSLKYKTQLFMRKSRNTEEHNKQDAHKYTSVKSVVKKPYNKDVSNEKLETHKNMKECDKYNCHKCKLLTKTDDCKKTNKTESDAGFEDNNVNSRKSEYISYKSSVKYKHEYKTRSFAEVKYDLSREEELFAMDLESRMQQIFKGCHYSVTAFIHKGKFSQIYKCKNSRGQNYAVKCLHEDSDLHVMGINEERMLKELQTCAPKDPYNCVFIVDGFSLFGSQCFLMDYYPINLAQALQKNGKSFHVDSVQNLAEQLISAVDMLRSNKIVHSDIKPTHILLNSAQGRLKLCGFDSAYYIYNVKVLSSIGTVCYRPPEVIMGFSAGYSVDVWTTALVLYEMATNNRLFKSYFNNNVLYKQICTLGMLPEDMIKKSLYKDEHFDGDYFMRKCSRGTSVRVYSFRKFNTINRTLLSSYNNGWSHKSKQQQVSDLKKLVFLNNLLDKMLVMHPKHRLPIYAVKNHPFLNI